MATCKPVLETPKYLIQRYPITGIITSFTIEARKAFQRCFRLPEKVNVPPIETKASGKVMEDIKARVLSTNTGNGIASLA